MRGWRGRAVAWTLAFRFGLPGLALAAPPGPRDPDWPCQQIKVPALSVAAMWSGPDLPDRAAWRDDAEVAALVARLAERRVPLEVVQAEVAGFATRAGAQRSARLPALFAGLFETANAERDSVLVGLDRFGRRQSELAAGLRADAARLSALRANPEADPAQVEHLAEQVTWKSRVFEDRSRTLSYVCDVPQRIEQRLFGLARTIQQALE